MPSAKIFFVLIYYNEYQRKWIKFYRSKDIEVSFTIKTILTYNYDNYEPQFKSLYMIKLGVHRQLYVIYNTIILFNFCFLLILYSIYRYILQRIPVSVVLTIIITIKFPHKKKGLVCCLMFIYIWMYGKWCVYMPLWNLFSFVIIDIIKVEVMVVIVFFSIFFLFYKFLVS